MKKNLLILLIILSIAKVIFPQGSVMLVGGGTENYNDWSDMPYKWFVEHAQNKKILVLHYSSTSTFFTNYFPSLSPCTVSNLAINSKTLSNDSSTYKYILEHDGIFLRGGDQGQYVSIWKNTLVQKAIKEVFQRGGVIGGTSAGEMVLSEVNYLGGNSDSGVLLRNSTNSITLENDFLNLVPNTLAESHTNERGRLGRLVVFLARYKSTTGKSITGIAVDVNTALVIEPNGVAEVMGGSAVAFMRWQNNTSYIIQAGNPFALQNMKFDQLLPGYKINLNTFEITKNAGAVQFIPKEISLPKSTVLLDGSGNINEWISSNGSINKFKTFLTSFSDTVGIISSPIYSSLVNTLMGSISQNGINSVPILLNDKNKNDLLLSQRLKNCNAFIFVGNTLDSLAYYLNNQSTVGIEFLLKLENAKPILFLGDDVMFAGEKVISGLYNSYSAYYGTLKSFDGLNLFKGIQLMPRFYQNKDNSRGYNESENRIMGLFWMMAMERLPIGIIIDAGTFVVIKDGKYEVEGILPTSTPVIMFDARNSSWVEFPVFKRPGKPNSVQNAALLNALFNVIRPNEKFELTGINNETQSVPNNFLLKQNYPNPFNPITTFQYEIPQNGYIKLKIYDLLGREVSSLRDEFAATGIYKAEWNAANYSSGVYFVKLDYRSKNSFNSGTIKIILSK